MLLVLLAGAGLGSSGAPSIAERGLSDLPPQSPSRERAPAENLRDVAARNLASASLAVKSPTATNEDHKRLKAAQDAGDILALVAVVSGESQCDTCPRPSESVRTGAARQLTILLKGGDAYRVAIAQAGAIKPLVALVSGDSAGAQEAAAAALHWLAFGADNQLAIARAGAIEPLVALLHEPVTAATTRAAATASTKEPVAAQQEAAGALSALAAFNKDNQAAIARAGARHPNPHPHPHPSSSPRPRPRSNPYPNQVPSSLWLSWRAAAAVTPRRWRLPRYTAWPPTTGG